MCAGASVSVVANRVLSWRMRYRDPPPAAAIKSASRLIPMVTPEPAVGSQASAALESIAVSVSEVRSMRRLERHDPRPSGVRVWLAVGQTEIRHGMNGLALQAHEALRRDPHAADLFVFRGSRGDLIKIIWHDSVGMSLYAKRLEKRAFIWPSPTDGVVAIRRHNSIGNLCAAKFRALVCFLGSTSRGNTGA